MPTPVPDRNGVSGQGGAQRPILRLPLLALGVVGLVVGIGAGLGRLGWSVPDVAAASAALHGPLMIGAFLGVVIGIERAVALGRRWAYLGPLLAGLGGVAAVGGAVVAGAWLGVAGSVVLLVATLAVCHRQPAPFTFVLALGAGCWAVGNATWALGAAPHAAVKWWLAFPILTIAGERLELSRFLPPSPVAVKVLAAVLTALVAGLPGDGGRLFGLGLLGLSAWLLKQDLARRTVRGRGLTRFIAVCLLSGYGWLLIAAGMLLAAGRLAPGAPSYDAAVHAIALGFVFSMVFGHAPIIVPAVLRVRVAYHPVFYAPLVLLNASLACRLAGDVLGRFAWTRTGALLNAAAIALFVLVTATAVARGRRLAPVAAAPAPK